MLAVKGSHFIDDDGTPYLIFEDRPNGWHIGTYVPYRKRATLHDGAWKQETRDWYKRWFARLEEERKLASV